MQIKISRNFPHNVQYKVDQAWFKGRHWLLIASTFVCKNAQKENLHSFNGPVEILCLCMQNTNKKHLYCYNKQLSLPTDLILVSVSGDWLWFVLCCDHNGQLHQVYRFASLDDISLGVTCWKLLWQCGNDPIPEISRENSKCRPVAKMKSRRGFRCWSMEQMKIDNKTSDGGKVEPMGKMCEEASSERKLKVKWGNKFLHLTKTMYKMDFSRNWSP